MRFRHLRTTQERRRFVADKADNIKLRAGRSLNYLPTNWDDLQSRIQRCWKEQRRTKWHPITS